MWGNPTRGWADGRRGRRAFQTLHMETALEFEVPEVQGRQKKGRETCQVAEASLGKLAI